MRGAMHPLTHTSSWRGAQLSTKSIECVFVVWYFVKPRDKFTLAYLEVALGIK